jgi:hypothetical protein
MFDHGQILEEGTPEEILRTRSSSAPRTSSARVFEH